jgi:hypothetical protein
MVRKGARHKLGGAALKRLKYIQGGGAIGECGLNHGWILD